VAAKLDLRALSPEFNTLYDVVLKREDSADILDFHTPFLRSLEDYVPLFLLSRTSAKLRETQ